jgi:hypothetical protein
MAQPVALVADALEYYDINSEKYSNFFKSIHYIKFEESSSDLHNNLYMYDSNKNLLFKSRYEVLGLYASASKTWTWAWSIPYYKRNNTLISKKILNYGIDLDPTYKFLKTELVTSRFRINDAIQLDIHVAIASYLSKQPFVYKYTVYSSSDVYTESEDKLFNIKDNKPTDTYSTYYMFLLDQLPTDIYKNGL